MTTVDTLIDEHGGRPFPGSTTADAEQRSAL
jgi:hypothetical protein